MAFLRLPTKTESKRSIAPAPQAPKPLPKAAPRPAAVPVKPAVRGAPGPTTVAEGPKRRMLGLGTVRVGRQYTVLGATFAVLFVASAVVVFIDNREATYGTVYVSTAAHKLLTLGGQAGDVSLPPSSDTVKPYLDALTKEWDKTDRSAQLVLAQSKNLIGLGISVRQINSNNPVLLDLAEQIQALKLQSQAPAREVSLSGQLVMLTQRLAKNANAMLGADVIDPEVAFLMGKDTTSFRELVQGLIKGSDVLRIAGAK